MSILRYGLEEVRGCGEYDHVITEQPDGEYVKFDDIKELLQTSTNTAHGGSEASAQICPQCNGSGLPQFVNQTNCTLCKGKGKLHHA